MTDTTNTPAADRKTEAAPRRTWQTPSVTRIRAGEAELGANQVNPEGAFAFGS